MCSAQCLGGKLCRFSGFVVAIAGLLLFSLPLLAQTTVGTGSIVGTVTDPSGAVLSGAKVAITNVATGQTLNRTTNSAGAYNSGALVPGEYKVQISSKGFSTASLPVTVLVGNTATANAKLAVGQETTVIEVQASTVQVNTEQPTVQGVLNAQQIENLPVNGRNFLDLAQLEPGVQIQDGQNFDPTKVGYSSISFGGRFGRTARISVDGVDVSDETVGTTTQDIPASSIQEFQLSQSNLDLSNELTSSGAVNVTTRSGTNAYHGEGFYLFRDSSAAAALPSPSPSIKTPFQRHQFGGRFGGPIKKDKLFFFLDAERTKQDLAAPILVDAPFSAFSGTFQAPFRENETLARVDYALTQNARMFYRFTYFDNSVFGDAGTGFQVYKNLDDTRNHLVGIDFNTGSFTHAIRFSYLKFQNQIHDATLGGGLPLANFPLTLNIGTLFTGPNLLAPQSTPQSDHQLKYDGSKVLGTHVLRYGLDYNHLVGGGFAAFFAITPNVFTSDNAGNEAFAAAQPGCMVFNGQNLCGVNNPLNWPMDEVILGSGQGFSTENPSFGFPAGRLGPDNRFGAYFGDSWKIKPNFTLTYGVRYVRDTGRTDSDLPPIPEVNALFPGLGNRVKQPNTNFAPQLGFAWDPFKSGKTSIRAGIGLFYENVIWNNVLFDRPLRLAKGAFLQTPVPCLGGGALPVPTNAGVTLTTTNAVCSSSIEAAQSAITTLQTQLQANSPFDPNTPNSSFIPALLASGTGPTTVNGNGVFAPDYKTPRSVQINAGIQRELRPGTVLSADYIRNVSTHYLLNIDANHAGDANFLNMAGALSAINLTAGAGCPLATNGPTSQAAVNCYLANTGKAATITDFAGNGLDSSNAIGGNCAIVLGTGVPCAFPGINPNAPPFWMLFPVGRSVYNGMDLKLTQDVKNPMRGMRRLNLQVSYSLSKFVNDGGTSFGTAGTPGQADQDFIVTALDQRAPNHYIGDSLLDRRHQLSFGGFADMRGGFQISIISHFYSPLAEPLLAPAVSGTTLGTGEIFATDFTGDGTGQDPLPGTNIGAFGRSANSATSVNNLINNYNNTVAGQMTPAGQALVNAGLFTAAQLKALGAVAPTITAAPAGQVGLDWLRAFDLKLSWSHTFKERVTIQPSVGLYNAFNFANFDLPPNTLRGVLDAGVGAANGTTYNQQGSNRVGVGTGVYGLGGPRVAEFGMRLTF
jgi:hypothetical protein